jgi:hypothetical protein
VLAAPDPVPGADYPRDWPEFMCFFGSEEDCLAYLERLRWPEGFSCPACGHGDAWRSGRAQASPERTIGSVSNIFISVASLPKTARLAAFQLAIFAAPYM